MLFHWSSCFSPTGKYWEGTSSVCFCFEGYWWVAMTKQCLNLLLKVRRYLTLMWQKTQTFNLERKAQKSARQLVCTAVSLWVHNLWLLPSWSAAAIMSVHCVKVIYIKEMNWCDVGSRTMKMLGTAPANRANRKQNFFFITKLCQITGMAAPYTQV